MASDVYSVLLYSRVYTSPSRFLPLSLSLLALSGFRVTSTRLTAVKAKSLPGRVERAARPGRNGNTVSHPRTRETRDAGRDVGELTVRARSPGKHGAGRTKEEEAAGANAPVRRELRSAATGDPDIVKKSTGTYGIYLSSALFLSRATRPRFSARVAIARARARAFSSSSPRPPDK